MYVVRRELLPMIEKNMASLDAIDAYAELIGGAGGSADMEMAYGDEELEDGMGYVAKSSRVIGGSNPGEDIIDIREYDIPYYLRVAIDKGVSDVLACTFLLCRKLTAKCSDPQRSG